MPAEDVTLAVLGTKLDNLAGQMSEVRGDIKTMREQSLDRRLTTVEENIKWIVRALVMTVLSVAGAIAAGLIRHP